MHRMSPGRARRSGVHVWRRHARVHHRDDCIGDPATDVGVSGKQNNGSARFDGRDLAGARPPDWPSWQLSPRRNAADRADAGRRASVRERALAVAEVGAAEAMLHAAHRPQATELVRR
jgi:hypothetical protein